MLGMKLFPLRPSATPGRHHIISVLLLAAAVLIRAPYSPTGDARAASLIRTTAPYAIVMHANSRAVLMEKRADDLIPPASMSKLMTLLMVFEALKAGDIKPDEEFFISERAFKRGGSRMFAKLGSSVPVEALIQAVAVQSANDACIALAEGLSGTEEAFAEEMTARARELGLTKSTFRNSTGWPDPEHMVTPRELALIARHLIFELGDYYHYFAQPEFMWNKIKQRNRNPLLRLNIGVDGLKTGHTKDAGYGLVASAEKDGQRIIVVLGGLKTSKERAEESRKLLQWAMRAFKAYRLFEDGAVVGEAAVWGGEVASVSLVAEADVTMLMSRPARRKVRAEIVYTGPVPAPIKRGQEIAKLRVTSIDGFNALIPLYAADDVEKGGLLKGAVNAVRFMLLGG